MDRKEIPVGFAMALAQNPEAMEKFASFSEDKKRETVAGTHQIKSREDMHRYVMNLATGNQAK